MTPPEGIEPQAHEPLRRFDCGPDGGVVVAVGKRLDPSAWWFEPSALRGAGLLAAEWPAGRGVIRRLHAACPGVGGFWALRHYQRGGLAARWLDDRYLYTGLVRTRAWRELELLAAMRAAGLPTPTPIAARVQRYGLWYRADLLTEWLADTESVDAHLRRGPLAPGLWERMGACIRRFHDAGFCHADLNSRNILFDPDGQVWVLDWDRGQRRSPGPWRQANLQRLRHDLDKRRRQGLFCGYTDADFTRLVAGYQQARQSMPEG